MTNGSQWHFEIVYLAYLSHIKVKGKQVPLMWESNFACQRWREMRFKGHSNFCLGSMGHLRLLLVVDFIQKRLPGLYTHKKALNSFDWWAFSWQVCIDPKIDGGFIGISTQWWSCQRERQHKWTVIWLMDKIYEHQLTWEDYIYICTSTFHCFHFLLWKMAILNNGTNMLQKLSVKWGDSDTTVRGYTSIS